MLSYVGLCAVGSVLSTGPHLARAGQGQESGNMYFPLLWGPGHPDRGGEGTMGDSSTLLNYRHFGLYTVSTIFTGCVDSARGRQSHGAGEDGREGR